MSSRTTSDSTSSTDPYESARFAASVLAQRTARERHDLFVVLGSGWARVADLLPNGIDVPMTELLSKTYNDNRRKLIDMASASLEQRPGKAGGRQGVVVMPQAGTHKTGAGVGEPTLRREGVGEPTVTRDGNTRGDTCHIDIIDRHGNMVAATPSGGWLSSSPTIPALGFALNTRLQMTWLEPGLPNTLAPGKRPCTTLSPSLCLRDGEPYMVFGRSEEHTSELQSH